MLVLENMAKRPIECGEHFGINIFFSKKRNTENIEEISSSSSPGQPNEPIEQLFPIRQDIATLPNPLPKASSGHSVQKTWFEEFFWLKIAKDFKSLYCISCHWAFTYSRLIATDMNIVSNSPFPWKDAESGWNNMKKGRDGVKKHNNSRIHSNSQLSLNIEMNAHEQRLTLRKATINEYTVNRRGLKAVFESVKLCGQQGLALRGHRNEEKTGNLNCIVNLIGKFNPMVEKYLASESKMKFLSPGVQNEVLKIISNSLLRNIINRLGNESIGITKEPVFSLIMDETADINRSEQVSFCLRFCNGNMESEEVFLGFHQTRRTNSETLLHLVKTSLLSFGLPFSGIRGQGYDGASNMSGKNNGLQAKVSSENSKALYLYCFGHQLNLVVQDALVDIPEVVNALERMNAVVHFIKNSPKKWQGFQMIVEETNVNDNHMNQKLLRPLCPTRWVMRLPAVDAFLIHYESILEFLESIKDDGNEPVKNRDEALSYLLGLETFQNYFSLRIVQRLLQFVQPIHTQCQGKKATTGNVRDWVNTLVLTLIAEGENTSNAEALFESVKLVTIQDLRLDLPALPRAKRSARNCGSPEAISQDQVNTYYLSMYTSVMKIAAKSLLERFSKNDLTIVELLRKTLEEETITDLELKKIVEFYDSDIKLDCLIFERKNWFSRCTGMGMPSTIATLRDLLAEEVALKWMIPNLHMLCVIYVCLPVTTCEAERSFSTLRRIHSYLRNCQTQQRLNHCAILAVHKDIVREMEMEKLMDEFVDATPQRRNMFGPPPLEN